MPEVLVRVLVLAGASLVLFACDVEEGVNRLDGAVDARPEPADGAEPEPDVSLLPDLALDAAAVDDAQVSAPDGARDVGPDTGPDAGPDAALDVGVDAAPDARPADMGVPPGCLPWVDVPDDALVAELHAELHRTYRPIAAEVDLGGNLNRYTTARRLMFTEVEWYEDPERGEGGHQCVYTGRFIPSPADTEPDDDIMNCEHTWPRARMSPRDTLAYSHEQSDIHHLLPTISGVNSLRGSERFGNVENGRNLDFLPAVYGTDASGNVVFQPWRERQGDVARVIFYFSVRWGKAIRDDEEETLRGWMNDDPVDRRERARNDLVEGIQGNRNPFVDCPPLVDRIADFAAFEPLDTEDNLPTP